MVSNLFSTMPRWVKVMTVIFLIVVVIGAQAGGVAYYMNHLQEKVQTVPVVRAKTDLPRHKTLAEEDLETKRVRIEDTVSGYTSNVYDLIGQELTEPIAAREQFTKQKIGRATKKEGQITIEIPNAWILSYPQSLRSFDTIAIWEVLDPSKVNSVKVEGSVNQTTTQTSPTQTNSNASVEVSLKANATSEPSNDPFLKDITVAYFKDSASNDIQDAANSISPRITASAVGTKIEINVTTEQFGKIREKANKGYKFIVGYQ